MSKAEIFLLLMEINESAIFVIINLPASIRVPQRRGKNKDTEMKQKLTSVEYTITFKLNCTKDFCS